MDAQELFKKAEDLRGEEKFVESIEAYKQAREQGLQSGDKYIPAESLHMIGVIYYQQENFIDGLPYLEDSLKEFEKAGDKLLIGAVLRDLGQVAFEQKDLKKAKEYLEQSVEILKDLPESPEQRSHLGISQVKLGVVLVAQDQNESVIEMIEQGIKVLQSSNHKFFESIAQYNLSKVYQHIGKKKEAEEAAKKALSLLNEETSEDQHQSRRQKLLDQMESLIVMKDSK